MGTHRDVIVAPRLRARPDCWILRWTFPTRAACRSYPRPSTSDWSSRCFLISRSSPATRVTTLHHAFKSSLDFLRIWRRDDVHHERSVVPPWKLWGINWPDVLSTRFTRTRNLPGRFSCLGLIQTASKIENDYFSTPPRTPHFGS